MQRATVGSTGPASQSPVPARLAGVFARCVALVSSLALGAGCNDELVEEVPTTVCASGKRWVGEFTPNEEMYPGEDCVGCHLSSDGLPLMAAGTVYGLPDREGPRTSEPLC